MDSLRTSSLFHYTDFNGLKRILAGGLVPNYCSEDLTVGEEVFGVSATYHLRGLKSLQSVMADMP